MDGSKRLAWVYPGQGSQFVGMGAGLEERLPVARKFFDMACEMLGRDLRRIMFEGPEDELKQTINTQPAVLVVSAALHEALIAKGLEPVMVAGHSLGEYTALYAAGVLDFERTLQLVKARSELMHEAGKVRPGAMAAIMGPSDEKLRELCAGVNGVVVVANSNAPGQTVISGEVEAVAEAVERCKAAGAKRAVMLPVSGAFHSPLMEEPAASLRALIAETPFADARVPVVTNVDGKSHTSGAELKQNLLAQMTSSVLWTDTVRTIAAAGVDGIVEVGPGRVLTGLVKRIEPALMTANVGSFADVDVISG
ncbi:MAG: ACP S-malonyltransferase [Candidatus Sumerlaeaceae bacterium]|nr:ACP S-malonyltransferase [Candidatus Sumerlaeaceae bacterium]